MQNIFINSSEFRILEMNKISDYFLKNPDKLKRFDITMGKVKPKEIKWIINDIIVSIYGSDLSDKYERRIIKFIDNFKYNDEFIRKKKKPLTAKIIKSLQYKTCTEAKNDMFSMIDDTTCNELIGIIKLGNAVKNNTENQLKKISTLYGFTPEGFTNAIQFIIGWQSNAGKRIDKNEIDALRFAFVDKNNLPKMLYRGIFIEESKIKDVTKFLDTWKQDSTPKFTRQSLQSWTTDIEIAKGFAFNDPMKQGGYGIILQMKKPIYEDIVIDFRIFDIFTRFFNEKEVLINYDTTNYSVLDIKHSTEFNLAKSNRSTTTNGIHGISKLGYLQKYLNLEKTNLSPDELIFYREYKDSTVKDIIMTKFFGSAKYLSDNELKMSLPLYSMVSYICRTFCVTSFNINTGSKYEANLTFNVEIPDQISKKTKYWKFVTVSIPKLKWEINCNISLIKNKTFKFDINTMTINKDFAEKLDKNKEDYLIFNATYTEEERDELTTIISYMENNMKSCLIDEFNNNIDNNSVKIS